MRLEGVYGLALVPSRGMDVARDVGARILDRLERAGCEARSEVVAAAASFYELLFRWNRRVNLTALEDGDEAIDRLIVEPFVAGHALPAGGLLVDVGSGGGSPAIPLKLVRPAMDLVMVESRVRKGAFLREVVRHLGLAGVGVETRRLEDVAAGEDVVGRAVVISVRAVRLDETLLSGIERIGAPGVRLWAFGGLGQSEEPAGWALEASRPLVPVRGSVLRVFRRA